MESNQTLNRAPLSSILNTQPMKHVPYFLLLALLVLACGPARRGIPFEDPIALNTPELQQGQLVYMDKCSKCHPGGGGGLGPALNNKPLPGFAIKFQVRHGLGVMPAFKKDVISQPDLEALTEYLKAVR